MVSFYAEPSQRKAEIGETNFRRIVVSSMSVDSWPFDQPRNCAVFTTRHETEAACARRSSMSPSRTIKPHCRRSS
jgi:hypothetical protein